MTNEPDIVELLRSLGNEYADAAASTIEALREVEVAARECLSAMHLRTHGFPEGDISDLDFSKLAPAAVRLDKALRARTDASGAMGKETP